MSNSALLEAGSQERFTYAQIPLIMARDPLLTPTDIVVTMFIVPWMGERCAGWVAVGTIARSTGLTERGVQKSLRRLEETGWFGLVPSRNKTGREIIARWKTDDGFRKLRARLAQFLETANPRLTYTPDERGEPTFAPNSHSPDVYDYGFSYAHARETSSAPFLDPSANPHESTERPPLAEIASVEADDSDSLAAGEAGEGGGAGEGADDFETIDEETLRGLNVISRNVRLLYDSPGRGDAMERRINDLATAVMTLFCDEKKYLPAHREQIRRIARREIAPSRYENVLRRTARGMAEGWVANGGAYIIGQLKRRSDDEARQELAQQYAAC